MGMQGENNIELGKVEGRAIVSGWVSMAEKSGKGRAGLWSGGKGRKVVPV